MKVIGTFYRHFPTETQQIEPGSQCGSPIYEMKIWSPNSQNNRKGSISQFGRRRRSSERSNLAWLIVVTPYYVENIPQRDFEIGPDQRVKREIKETKKKPKETSNGVSLQGQKCSEDDKSA